VAPTHLADTLTVVRLSLHVAAATVWVGGQLVMAGLMRTVRTLGSDAPKKMAQAFGRLSWPAFWLLVVTGFWNFAESSPASATTSWSAVFGIKMLFVLIAGLGAWLHTKASTAKTRGMFAGIGMLATLVAMVLGVALAG